MSVRGTVLVIGSCIAPLLSAAPATAAEAETRVFNVLVDGKPAGEFRLTIRTADDTETATMSAAVHVKSLLGGYRYSFRGTETWSAGRLRQLDAASDDNGKKHTVRAAAEGDKLRVTVDGAGRLVRPDVWPTTYWRLPAGAKAGQSVALLDADTGEGTVVTINVGQQAIRVAGSEANCTRIAVTGPTPATIWYDSRGRMVSQETIEDGHKTVLTLREIQR
jgi:hypothetical protein